MTDTNNSSCCPWCLPGGEMGKDALAIFSVRADSFPMASDLRHNRVVGGLRLAASVASPFSPRDTQNDASHAVARNWPERLRTSVPAFSFRHLASWLKVFTSKQEASPPVRTVMQLYGYTMVFPRYAEHLEDVK